VLNDIIRRGFKVSAIQARRSFWGSGFLSRQGHGQNGAAKR
jgi:hypothetical protein